MIKKTVDHLLIFSIPCHLHAGERKQINATIQKRTPKLAKPQPEPNARALCAYQTLLHPQSQGLHTALQTNLLFHPDTCSAWEGQKHTCTFTLGMEGS
jgi:hypothetical protein